MSPYYSHDGIEIYHGDCRDIIPSLQADVVVTDPPWGTGSVRSTKGDDRGQFKVQRDREEWDIWNPEWLDLALQITDRIVSFCPYPGLPDLLQKLKPYSLRFWKKTNPRPPIQSKDSPVVDIIVVPPMTCGKGQLNVISLYNGDTELHPHQKPEDLMKWLISSYTRPNEVVLDPFMGSGTTLRAAKDLGRRAVGIELDEGYCRTTVERLAQEILPMNETGGSA